MKIIFFKKISILSFVVTLLFSCASNKDILYMQGTPQNATVASTYEPVLQPADELMIVISTENPELAVPYNLNSVSLEINSGLSSDQSGILTYLISKDGTIEMPILGKVKLAGLTRMQAIDKIKELLVNHIKDPMVNIRLINFKVSVIGEVTKPGTLTVQNERVTILEAISFAGDLTIYGKRNSIMIIREVNGVKTINTVDLTSSDLINSPYYFLAQNDVVYVEPNKTKVNSSVIGPNIAVVLSSVSLLIAILALTIN